MPRTIAVAGKGGTGKTTIAALMVTYLVEKRLGPVLAVDADPDANLGRVLGVAVDKTVGDLREEVRREMQNMPAGVAKADYVEAGLHGLVAEAEGFDLLSMGQGEGPGCYCALNSMIRKFSDQLRPSYQWTVMDNEAGLEHISRRTSADVDHLVIVVGANPISLETARRIDEISRSLKNNVRHRWVVTNGIPAAHLSAVRARIAELGIEHLADIPRDPAVEEASMAGTSLGEVRESAARNSVFTFMERIGGIGGHT